MLFVEVLVEANMFVCGTNGLGPGTFLHLALGPLRLGLGLGLGGVGVRVGVRVRFGLLLLVLRIEKLGKKSRVEDEAQRTEG